MSQCFTNSDKVMHRIIYMKYVLLKGNEQVKSIDQHTHEIFY